MFFEFNLNDNLMARWVNLCLHVSSGWLSTKVDWNPALGRVLIPYLTVDSSEMRTVKALSSVKGPKFGHCRVNLHIHVIGRAEAVADGS
jgi:hypothetical protein